MDGASTGDRILDAAAALWHDGGFEAVTTRAVAARAGVNEVTLFRHFANKEGLLKAMVERAVKERRPTGDAPGEAGKDLEQALRAWALAYLEETRPVGDVILLGLLEARGRPDLANACLSAPRLLRGALCARLAERCAAGEIPPGPFAEVAEAFYATLFAHVITAHLQEPGGDAEEIASRVARVFARALRPGDGPDAVRANPNEGGAPIGH